MTPMGTSEIRPLSKIELGHWRSKRASTNRPQEYSVKGVFYQWNTLR
jgi:hypothetical protein